MSLNLGYCFTQFLSTVLANILPFFLHACSYSFNSFKRYMQLLSQFLLTLYASLILISRVIFLGTVAISVQMHCSGVSLYKDRHAVAARCVATRRVATRLPRGPPSILNAIRLPQFLASCYFIILFVLFPIKYTCTSQCSILHRHDAFNFP